MNRLIKNWSLVRFSRLVLAIAISMQAIVLHQYIWLALGAFLFWQVWKNTGCGVNYSPSKNKTAPENVTYTEIKP